MTTTVARKYTVELHDGDDDLVAILDNAYLIAYTEGINSAPTLSFNLPADDDKAANIIKANEIWLRDYDDGSLINRFRLTRKSDARGAGLVTTVSADGLINQLAEELVITYSADNLTITQIVTALINLQVLTPAITVGTIDPTVSRSISIDGDTILRALYRLRDTVGGHIYVDSNRALQWKTSIGEDKGQQIRYKKNLKGIAREIDYTAMANRLYAYGAGEGDARIKLSDAEGQEEDYVENTDKQTEWGGIYIKVIVDKSITHPDTLLAWANLKLAELEDPRITYRVDAVDLSESIEVDFSFEALQIGSTIKVIDEDLGIDISAQVVKITHPDLLHPELMELEITNPCWDITDVLSGVYDIQQLTQHIATEIGAGQVIVKGAFTVLDWVTEGETTIVGSHIETGTIALNRLDFIPLTSAGATGEIIATINASVEEGITISADKISLLVGKSIFKQDGIPTSTRIGDLWFDTNDDNKLYRAASIGANEITAGEWELVQDEGIVANAASIVVNEEAITLNVTDIGTLDGRVTTNEGSISVNSDNILLRVSKNDVINQINISTEEIKIQSARITLDGTVAVTDDIESSNFVTGVSGWQIHGDGTAEFRDVFVRGEIQATSGSFTGTLEVTGAGELLAGGGDIVIDADGIEIKAESKVKFIDDSTEVGQLGSGSLGPSFVAAVNKNVRLITTGTGYVEIVGKLGATGDRVDEGHFIDLYAEKLYPDSGGGDIGSATKEWWEFFVSRIYIYETGTYSMYIGTLLGVPMIASQGANLGIVADEGYNVRIVGNAVEIYKLAVDPNDPTRADDTIYQNTGDFPLVVSVTAICGEAEDYELLIGSTSPPAMCAGRLGNASVDGNFLMMGTMIVPVDWYYKVETQGGNPQISEWTEYELGDVPT